MHIRNYLAALSFVNRERVTQGLAPLDHLPAGRPGDSNDCVIARAIPGASVGDRSFKVASAAPRIMPTRVADFVRAFDLEPKTARGERDPGSLVEGGIDDDKGCLVSA